MKDPNGFWGWVELGIMIIGFATVFIGCLLGLTKIVVWLYETNF